MYGPSYWAAGITVGADERADGTVRWGASLEFQDDGFVDADDLDAGQVSTVGRLGTRYFLDSTEATDGLTAAIDTIKADADRLGIKFRSSPHGAPLIHVRGDGEYADEWLPENWRGRLAAQARRLGWRTYGDPTGQSREWGIR
ncbi:hypothetical protein [Frankia sp. R43]|uniref:hypothetical protein n=1 Tax=Frankia sp. R43 TaxID=269536 RepID=UPI0006C9F690|nr:hypothetical protein [Frankia sp. R43]